MQQPTTIEDINQAVVRPRAGKWPSVLTFPSGYHELKVCVREHSQTDEIYVLALGSIKLSFDSRFTPRNHVYMQGGRPMISMGMHSYRLHASKATHEAWIEMPADSSVELVADTLLFLGGVICYEKEHIRHDVLEQRLVEARDALNQAHVAFTRAQKALAQVPDQASPWARQCLQALEEAKGNWEAAYIDACQVRAAYLFRRDPSRRRLHHKTLNFRMLC